MNLSAFPCPNCGSTDLRRSRINSKLEGLQTTFGAYPFRCLSCNYRFPVNIWLWSRLAFAKCPKCLRPELGIWPAKYYHLPLWKNLLVTFGAHRYRCAGCRHRFVSFRPLEKPATLAAPAAEIQPIPEETESSPEAPEAQTKA